MPESLAPTSGVSRPPRIPPCGSEAAPSPRGTPSMIRRLGWGVGIALTAALAASAHADATLERDFVFTREQVHVVDRAGTTEVTLDRGIAETTSGLPDLPALQQRVPLPEGLRVASIEVIALETEPLGVHPRVATSIVPTHGLGPIVRSAPDAARYAAAGFEPATPARVGLQGYEAGHGVAFVLAQPVRWDASTGQLE